MPRRLVENRRRYRSIGEIVTSSRQRRKDLDGSTCHACQGGAFVFWIFSCFFFHVAAKQHVFGCTYSCSCRKVASNGRGRAYVRHRREKMKRVLVKRYKNPERTSTNKWLRTTVKEVIFIYVYVLRTYIYTVTFMYFYLGNRCTFICQNLNFFIIIIT